MPGFRGRGRDSFIRGGIIQTVGRISALQIGAAVGPGCLLRVARLSPNTQSTSDYRIVSCYGAQALASRYGDSRPGRFYESNFGAVRAEPRHSAASRYTRGPLDC